MWEVLNREVDLGSVEGTTLFQDTSLTMAKEIGIISPSSPSKKPQQKELVSLSREYKRLIDSRHRVFQDWNNSKDLKEKESLWTKYLDLKKETRRLIKKEKKTQ